MLVPLTIYKFGKACDNRIQDGCDEYNRLKAFKAQTVYIVPSKPYQPDEVYVTPDKEEFYEAESRAIQREEEEAELRAIQRQEQWVNWTSIG